MDAFDDEAVKDGSQIMRIRLVEYLSRMPSKGEGSQFGWQKFGNEVDFAKIYHSN